MLPFPRPALPESAIVEFLAEDAMITIIPSFEARQFPLLEHTIDFHVAFPVEVPLWLALHLKQVRQCRIQCPEWLLVENLDLTYQQEVNENAFSPLPEHWYSMSRSLLQYAADDMTETDRIEQLLSDIKDVRDTKISRGLLTLTAMDGAALRFNHLSSMELCTHRKFITNVMEKFAHIESVHDRARQIQVSQNESQ